jgi:hypothetical protein
MLLRHLLAVLLLPFVAMAVLPYWLLLSYLQGTDTPVDTAMEALGN